MKMQNHSNQSI